MHKTKQFAVLAFCLPIWWVACGTSGGSQNLSAVDVGADLTSGDAFVEDDTQSDGVEPPCCPIVDTNQTQCYGVAECLTCPEAGSPFAGQDASFAGISPSYQDNGDDTVTDLNTGLMWQKTPGYMTFDDAVAEAAVSTHAGHDDWRLPTIKELYSLMDFSGLDPSGCESASDCALVPFIDSSVFNFEYGDESLGVRLIDAQYVSSTLYVSTTMDGAKTMFGVNFADGRIKGYPTDAMMGQSDGKMFYVLFVRGENKYGVNQFTADGDTVSDASTGLTWMKGDSGSMGAGTMNWEAALSFCEDLDCGGYNDWRLPNAKELQGIVDYTRSPATTNSAAIDPIFEATPITDEGGETNWAFYWTSTTHTNIGNGTVHGTSAAYVAFGEALGFMPDPMGTSVQLMDVHGAGAQRSDPKVGDAADYPTGFGPQGDVIRINNMVRCVRGGEEVFEAGATCQPTPAPVACNIAGEGEPCCGDGTCDAIESTSNCPADCETLPGGPTPCEVQSDCEAPEACPPDATLGCTCSATPDGDLCLPACETDSDCPAPPDMELICSMDGVCIPSGGPGRH